ncbi:gas vesicle protein [uncultured Sulfitobacter sp.]|uniref:gas vesicle protein n=1 Tax=uncultured Sulfitobacter sp. TaxID=191468 RepID=UPI002601FB4C|nr:gas vesicle protein [uncultured Sulfitobacter sp.]
MAVEMQMASPSEALATTDGRLVDLVDGLLDHGVVLRGGLWLTVADVELVFLGLDLVLSSPQKMRELKT